MSKGNSRHSGFNESSHRHGSASAMRHAGVVIGMIGQLACSAQMTKDTTTALSTTFRTINLKSSLSASYSTSRNWQTADFQNYALSGSFFLQDVGVHTDRRYQHQVLADLSYLKFVDSTWVKGTDRFLLSMLWSRSAKKWTHSYSVVFSTQFLPNEELAYDPGTESMRQVRYGGPLVPGTLELNYGAIWCPWPMSSVQFGFATAKVIATPRYALQDTTAEHTISAPNMVLDMEYGASVVANINHPLNDRLEWINSSRAFCNAFDRDHISFEVVNRLAIKLWKYVELRLDTHVGYDPLLSYKVGFSQEVLLGFFYQKQVSK